MYWKNSVKSWRDQKRRYRFLGKVGRVVSWTKVDMPPESFGGRCGYVVGLVEFGEDERAMGQVVGEVEGLRVGDRVKGVLRRLYEDGKEGVITYGVKFIITRRGGGE